MNGVLAVPVILFLSLLGMPSRDAAGQLQVTLLLAGPFFSPLRVLRLPGKHLTPESDPCPTPLLRQEP
jgi:hypothetical protein